MLHRIANETVYWLALKHDVPGVIRIKTDTIDIYCVHEAVSLDTLIIRSRAVVMIVTTLQLASIVDKPERAIVQSVATEVADATPSRLFHVSWGVGAGSPTVSPDAALAFARQLGRIRTPLPVSTVHSSFSFDPLDSQSESELFRPIADPAVGSNPSSSREARRSSSSCGAASTRAVDSPSRMATMA